MIQALYSRSPASVTEHLKKVKETGSSKFMSSFYLGYGHGSIGDCGFITIYFEGISMLAAKALEDNPLFNGQECSSRYIDFSTQPFHNPYSKSSKEHDIAEELFNDIRSFYVTSLPIVKNNLRQRFEKPEGENDVRYEKTISARAFDILRGFLPSGATTNVAWTTSLRKADEFLIHLMHHPLVEVQRMACEAYKSLYETYPSSFREDYFEASKVNSADLFNMLFHIEGIEIFEAKKETKNFYSFLEHGGAISEYKQGSITSNAALLLAKFKELKGDTFPSEYSMFLESGFYEEVDKIPLPRHDMLSRQIVSIKDTLDFGSYRDIQRHRNGYCSNEILTLSFGFHDWYMDNLSSHKDCLLKARAQKLLTKISRLNEGELGRFSLLAQYIVPMGYKVPVLLEYSIDQCRYVAKLRSGKTVHATLRPLAQKMGNFLNDTFGMNVIFDNDEADWTLKRGDQDIVAKQEVVNEQE